MRTALIDADILRYEVGAVGQTKDEIRSFDFVKEVFDERIRTIKEGAEADSIKLFITADPRTYKIAQRSGIISTERYVPNFREELAKGKTYKGTRKQEKPFHWLNLTAHVLSGEFPVSLAIGCEADDLMGIEQHQSDTETIICTRDKDLRQIPGLHYGWECGRQAEFGPIEYSTLGKIDLVRGKSSTKIIGGGFAFFCAQLLTGDVVDNIGGAKGIGPVKAYEYLADLPTERELFNSVRHKFEELDSERWKELLKEQCDLLWIIRERSDEGELKLFDLERWIDGEVSGV